MKNDADIQHTEAYRVWQTYALGKSLPLNISVSRQGKSNEEMIIPSVNAIYEHLAFEDEMLVWRYIEENYLKKYSAFMCLRFEWSTLACWQIDFPGSEQLRENIMPEELNLPQTVIDELEAWHSERDQLAKPWNDNDYFDYRASDVKGLSAALSMRPYLRDDVYFEYNLFHEIKIVDGEAVELPIPSFIVTICNWRAMIQACVSGDFDRVQELLHEGVDLNLMHPRKMDTIFTEFMAWLYDYPPTEPSNYKPFRVQMIEQLISSGADVNVYGAGDSSPLYYALMAFDADVAKLLLTHGANPNQAILEGETDSKYDFYKMEYIYEQYVQKGLSLPDGYECPDTEEGWLDFYDEMAKLLNTLPPTHLRILRAFGAKTYQELKNKSIKM